VEGKVDSKGSQVLNRDQGLFFPQAGRQAHLLRTREEKGTKAFPNAKAPKGSEGQRAKAANKEYTKWTKWKGEPTEGWVLFGGGASGPFQRKQGKPFENRNFGAKHGDRAGLALKLKKNAMERRGSQGTAIALKKQTSRKRRAQGPMSK